MTFLTSKIGGGIAWGLTVVLTIGLMYYYITANNRALEIKTLKHQVELLQIANETISEVLKKKDQSLSSLDLLLEGCFTAYGEYTQEKDVVEKVVTKIVTKPISDIKGVADEKGSSDAIDTYNTLFRMWGQ